MHWLRRVLLSGAIVIAVVVVVSGGMLASITARSLAQVNGSLRLTGLASPVAVQRDSSGVVQIYADSPHDLFMAQGYVHAQERLWQMEVWRHISAGRLAELFGPTQLRTDKFIRMLGWRQSAQLDLEAASPTVRAALDAYAAGVNAYLGDHRGNLGLPFIITGLRMGAGSDYVAEPWTTLDSMAWAKVQSWNLGGNFDSEVFRLLADAQLGDPARTDQLLPPYPASGPIIVPGITAGANSAVAAAPAQPSTDVTTFSPDQAAAWHSLAELSRVPLQVAGLDGGQGLAGDHGIGSNNWVVGPSLSATGHALLANDPHLSIGMPSLWFMNGLHCRAISAACPFDVVGVSFPGVPAVVLGHNARIAWGATNAHPDTQDLFIEKIDPANPGAYLFQGTSIPFDVRTETIKVAGAADVQLVIRSTGHGPIVNDVDDQLKDSTTLFALQVSATTGPESTVDAIFDLNTASNFTEFRAALSKYGSPAQNFVFADVDGHIGYQLPGDIPIRADPADLGDRPVPGWDGLHEWTDRIAFDDLPRLYDPPSGLIVTANNAIVDEAYPWLISRESDPGYRAARILDRLAADATTGVTLADMSAIQNDVRVSRASLIVPALREATAATADGRTVLERIRAWDQSCDIASRGCAAYMTFEYRVLRDLFDDDLGLDLARDYVGTTMSWQALIDLLARPLDPYWDDLATPARETAHDIIGRALDEAGQELRTALGGDSRWTWGRLHTATFREATLGSSGIGPLEWYFNSGPYPVAGAGGAVLNTYWKAGRAYPDPFDPTYTPTGLIGTFAVTNLPSYRQVIDLGDLDTARFIQTTGNSGNPFDRHYGDLIDDWLDGRLIPMPFSRAAIDQATVSTLMLTP